MFWGGFLVFRPGLFGCGGAAGVYDFGDFSPVTLGGLYAADEVVAVVDFGWNPVCVGDSVHGVDLSARVVADWGIRFRDYAAVT